MVNYLEPLHYLEDTAEKVGASCISREPWAMCGWQQNRNIFPDSLPAARCSL